MYKRQVHADERFVRHRPLVAGDEVVATVRVEAVKSLGGNRMVTTVTEIADLDGAAVSTVMSTLLVRGEES